MSWSHPWLCESWNKHKVVWRFYNKSRDNVKIKVQFLVHVFLWCWHIHFSDCIPHTTKLGKFIYALFFDDCAVHVETHCFCSPEELLCLWKWCHRAGKQEKCTVWKTLKDKSCISKGTNICGCTDFSSEGLWLCTADACLHCVTKPCMQWMTSIQWSSKYIHWLKYLCADVSASMDLFPNKHVPRLVVRDEKKTALHKVCLSKPYDDRPSWTSSGRIASPPTHTTVVPEDGEQDHIQTWRRWNAVKRASAARLVLQRLNAASWHYNFSDFHVLNDR